MFEIIRAIFHFPIDIWQLFITYLPGASGFVLRRIFWKKRLRFLGANVRIDVGVHFQNPKYISIGSNSWIDRNVVILAGRSTLDRVTLNKENRDFQSEFGVVTIGDNTHIAPNCVLSGIAGLTIGNNCGVASNSCLYSFSHHYRNLLDTEDGFQYSFTPMARLDQQSMIASPIVIHDYCAVGLSCVILPGVTLKKGTWIASNMVISNNFEEQSLVFADQVIRSKDLSSRKIKE